MRKQAEKCSVPECDREAFALHLCQACYHRARYWHKRSMKDKVRRVRQLKVWESSLELQLGNVRTMRRKTG